MPLKPVLFYEERFGQLHWKFMTHQESVNLSVYLLSDRMETNLFITEHTLQTYNKIKWKPHFIWEFKVKFSYYLAYYYFIQAMQQKCVIIQLH